MKKGRHENLITIFENKDYRITEIPKNYAIDVKIMVEGNKRHKNVKLLSEQFYSPLDRGVEYAHEFAKYMIDKYIKDSKRIQYAHKS